MELLKNNPKFMIGCDPEFFFAKNKKIIGSEKVIPENGIISQSGKIIRDGIQCELNPIESQCRESLGYHIQGCFKTLLEEIKKNKTTAEIDFTQTVSISKKEMLSLSDKSKTFGCEPSFNVYTKENLISIKDASTYMKRSAGGHIHLGTNAIETSFKKKLTPEKLIPLLDLLVGNTSVLIDRDKGNIERRKVYGKAGEYRTPPHGIEYRTLSNFWLKSYPLFSFATGMARYAVNILLNTTQRKNNYAKEFLNKVNKDDVILAINNNDFNLAMQNFLKIEQIIAEITPLKAQNQEGFYPLNKTNIDLFKYFVKKGTDYWFPDDPISHWGKIGNKIPIRDVGFNAFLLNTVKKKINQNLIKNFSLFLN